jgi:hypothetical protein
MRCRSASRHQIKNYGVGFPAVLVEKSIIWLLLGVNRQLIVSLLPPNTTVRFSASEDSISLC